MTSACVSWTVVSTAMLGLVLILAPGSVRAQEEKEPRIGWFNSADLGLVATDGNSNTDTFGFKNDLQRLWPRSRLRLKLDAVRSNSADDRFAQLKPGIEWEPGGSPPEGAGFDRVEPPKKLDAERYFLEGHFDRRITDGFFWDAGASWDRNEDAGILNRVIAFAGVGSIWWDREDLHFDTSYGLSYTDREETDRDPEKDDQFAGFRLDWGYMNKWGRNTTFTNGFTGNMNVSDTSDYNADLTVAVTVSMSNRLALRVSVQWLFSNKPALEKVDLVARLELIDPDQIPGNGDELFRSVAEGGAEIELGQVDIRKERLDTIFGTSLVISF